jgi:intein/homing endonuclease
LADGTTKPLVELKAGERVLSLNEQTQKLEPHKVNALLDMGIKPVYKITTAGGKSLKTTLTHPYLTKNGWRKLSEIRAGEEVVCFVEQERTGAGLSSIGLPANFNTFNKNDFSGNIKRYSILTDTETMGAGRQIDQGFGADKGVFQAALSLSFLSIRLWISLGRDLKSRSPRGVNWITYIK